MAATAPTFSVPDALSRVPDALSRVPDALGRVPEAIAVGGDGGTRLLWLLGLGLVLLLMLLGGAALLLHSRLRKLQRLQMASGLYSGGDDGDDGGDADGNGDGGGGVGDDDAGLGGSPVAAYAVGVDLAASAALEQAAPAAGRVQERLPVACPSSNRTTSRPCRYMDARWMVIDTAGGQGGALYEAVVQGRAGHALLAGVQVRLLLPDAHTERPSADVAAALRAQLGRRPGRSGGAGGGTDVNREPDGGFDQGGAAGSRPSWAATLEGLGLQALLVCPAQSAQPASGAAGCKYAVSLPIESAPAGRVTALLGSGASTLRALLLAW